MRENQFRELVTAGLGPMLGARIEDGLLSSTTREKVVSYIEGPNSLAVKPTVDTPYRLRLRRAKHFQPEEKQLAEDFITEVGALVPAAGHPYFDELVQALPRRVIARHLTPRERLRNVLERLERWSSQTYEGHRITCAIGLSPLASASGIPAAEYWTHSFAPVLSNGYDTLVEIDNNEDVAGLRQLPPPSEVTYAPHRLGCIAEWTGRRNRVAVALNSQGEVLVFKQRYLRFARRSGRWSHFPHELVVQTMAPAGSRELREAVYVSALDVSFSRTGGCIAIVQSAKASGFDELVEGGDRIRSSDSYKARLMRVTTPVSWEELDRRLRQELLALDGAVVLDHEGRVMAAGAIVKVPGGSMGGGRRAAAVQLSRLGTALKVSADGPIEVFKDGDSTAIFRVA